MILAPLRGVTIRCFRETFAEQIREAGFSEGIWVEDPHGDWEDQFKLDNMIKVVTDTYGVSYTAASIQLRRQGLLMKEWQYDQMKMRGV